MGQKLTIENVGKLQREQKGEGAGWPALKREEVA